MDAGFHVFYFSEGKHANMNSQCDNGHQQQQQSGNGCNHQGPDQSHKPQPVDGPEMQALPMPIPDPPIQYTKVSIRFSVTVLCTGFYVIKKEKNDPILCAWDFFLCLNAGDSHGQRQYVFRSSERGISGTL